MPVTAKLSKQFYERLGEAVANELVDWMNQVDAAYKSDLKEVNEINFARFDARLEQRIAELRSDLRTELAALDAKIDLTAERMSARLEKRLGEQTRFYVIAWGVLLASIVSLWFR